MNISDIVLQEINRRFVKEDADKVIAALSTLDLVGHTDFDDADGGEYKFELRKTDWRDNMIVGMGRRSPPPIPGTLLRALVFDDEDYERVYFAILKKSGGNLTKFNEAFQLAKRDWRDILVAAGMTGGDWPKVIVRAGMANERWRDEIFARWRKERLAARLKRPLWREVVLFLILPVGFFTVTLAGGMSMGSALAGGLLVLVAMVIVRLLEEAWWRRPPGFLPGR